MSRFKTILLWAWFIIFVILFSLTLMMSKGRDAIFSKAVPFSILGIFLLPFIIYGVIFYFTDKAKQKKKQEQDRVYREKYVRPLELETEQFGLLQFDYDTSKDTLKWTNGNVPFIGKSNDMTLEIEDYRGRNDLVISAISNIHELSSKIVEECVQQISDCFDELEVKDEKGQPISKDFIKNDIYLDEIGITLLEDSADIRMTGNISTNFANSFLDEYYLEVEIEGKTGKLECYYMQ